MGARSCRTSRSACPRSSNFPSRSAFPRSCTTLFSRSPALSHSYFTFLCSCCSPISSVQLPVKLRYNGGGGGLVSSKCCHLGVLLWRGGGILTTGQYLTTADGQSCFTECMREWGAPVISAQEREFSVTILSRSAFLYKI